MGKVKTRQQRCVYCVRHKRVKSDKRAIRTSWTCICHPESYCCKKSECWIEHLADNEYGHSDNNGSERCVADSGSSSGSDSNCDSTPSRPARRVLPRRVSSVIPRMPRAAGVELPLSQPAPTLRASDHNLDI